MLKYFIIQNLNFFLDFLYKNEPFFRFCFLCSKLQKFRQGSVSGSVNQATWLPDFEDVLRTGAHVDQDFQHACLCTNSREGVAGPKLLAEGPKPKACSVISSCPRELDQSPTPAMIHAILGINILLWLCC